MEPNLKWSPDGRQLIWSAHSLGIAKDCKRKYFYAIVNRWERRGDSVHLVFGGHYADALEHYHKHRAAGADHDEAQHLVIKETLEASFPWTNDHNAKTRETLIRSIVWYTEEYQDDPCQTVILANGKPAVELEFNLQLNDEIMLAGRIDRVVNYAGDYYIQDQKTTGSTVGSWYFKRYTPDNQMSLLTVAGQVIWKLPVKGVMVDAAQIAVGFTRFERGFAFRTQEMLEEWLRDAEYHIRETWRAEEAGWPMNDSACQKYGGCPFLDICNKSPQVREEFLRTSFEKQEAR